MIACLLVILYCELELMKGRNIKMKKNGEEQKFELKNVNFRKFGC